MELKKIFLRTLIPFVLLLIALFLLMTFKGYSQDTTQKATRLTPTTSNNFSDTGRYDITDLNSGQPVELYYDTAHWRAMNRSTNQPVEYYVIHYRDSRVPDTVHGVTGLIVNGMVVKNNPGWAFNASRVRWDGNELKMKDRYGRIVKWEAGQLKVKDWNSKYKTNTSGDAKYREEWDTVKWRNDQMTKSKMDGLKAKTDQ
jgi:hypothetical protein